MKHEFRQEIEKELDNILHFWSHQSIDTKYGGFIGKMNNDGSTDPDAEKGGVLNARILWTFSAALEYSPKATYQECADRAYLYLNQYFMDTAFGGTYWSVQADGQPGNTRKQVYGQAFTIYGLTEYFKITHNPKVLEQAIFLFETLELYSFDKKNGGYWEAFSRDWKLLDDLRLSPKDRNDPKTMNTHLHIAEAYVNLYRVWKNERLANKIRHLLEMFRQHIIDDQTWHLKLFFNSDWINQSAAISFGHDIEASWLLLEAAEVLRDDLLLKEWSAIALKMADATAECLNKDGSLCHEYDPLTRHWDKHREWWVSAEAMVGFLNAYKISNDAKYLDYVLKMWNFTQEYLIDKERGEWYWGVYDDYSIMKDEDKIGFWKCPYHNARACIEILKRSKLM